MKARLSLLDKNIGTSARFYAYVTDKSPTKYLMYFLDRGCVPYAPYNTFVWLVVTPLTYAVRGEMSSNFCSVSVEVGVDMWDLMGCKTS